MSADDRPGVPSSRSSRRSGRRETSRWSPAWSMSTAEDLAESLDIVPGEQGPRRRLRQRQRRDRRGPPGLGQHHRRRLRPGAARARPRAGRGRAPRDRVRRGRRRGSAVRGRELRRRDVDLRGDVRPRPAEDRRRAAAGLQAGRPDRDGQLGPGRLRRRDVHDHGQACPAAAGRRSPGPLGNRGAAAGAVRRQGSRTCEVERRTVRAALSTRPTTGSRSSAPTSDRPRSPSSGSGRRARMRWRPTCGRCSRAPTPPASARW